VTIAGFVDEPLGTQAYAALEQIRTIDPAVAATSALVRFNAGVDRDAMRRTLSAQTGVVAYEDTQALRQPRRTT